MSTPEEESALARIPDLRVAQKKFLLQHATSDQTASAKSALKQSLLKDISEQEMTPFYRICCKELGWKQDETLEADLKVKNEAKLKELEEKIADAEENLGESEVREALLAKSDYLAQVRLGALRSARTMKLSMAFLYCTIDDIY